MDRSQIIVVYPGRFQPFHKGHKSVYDHLLKDWAHVYIATTDKVQPGKSPFNFQDKIKFMGMLDVESNKVLQVRNTYNGQDYIDHFTPKFDASNTGLIMVVSDKDMQDDARFNFPNLGMSLKKDGNPAYLQKYTDHKNMKSMAEHGYIMTAPVFPFKVAGHDVDSASQLRELMSGDEELAKQVFVDLYDKYNEDIFKLIRERLMITENDILDLNYMRKMAGLNEIDADDDDYSDSPGYKEMPMFDQLGKIIDSDEMSKDGDDIKNPKATVKTDDGSEIEVSVEEAKAVRKMLNMLGSNRGADPKSPREKFQDAIQTSEGLMNMIDFAKTKGLVEEGDVEEGNEYGEIIRTAKMNGKKKGDKIEGPDGEEITLEDVADMFVTYVGEDKEGIMKKLTKATGAMAGGSVGAAASGGNPIATVGGAFAGMEGGDMLSTAMDRFLKANRLNAPGIKGQLTDYIERMIQDTKDKGQSAFQKIKRVYKDKRAQESVDLNDIRHDYGVSPVSEGGNAFDMAMTDAEDIIMTCQSQEECLKDLEALMVSNPEDFDDKYANEVVQDFITMVIDKGIDGAKEHVENYNREPEGAPLESKGSKPDYIDIDGDGDKEEPMKKAVKDKKNKEESFDPAMEPSEDSTMYDDAMEAYADNGEEGLCDFFGCTMSEMSTEIEDMCREKGLHPDDDRDECIPHVVDDMIDNRERKDHGEPEMDEDLERMRKLAGLVNTDETTMSEPQFKYDTSSDHESNYSAWKSMNDKEYRNNQQQPKSPEESRREFERQYSKFGGSNTKKSKGDDGSAQAFRNMMKAGQPRSIIDK
jgi:hypothetical protein